jgi:hypothetical protein
MKGKKMSITEQRNHVSLLVRQEGFEDWMDKIKNKFRFSYAMKEGIRKVK